MSQSQTTSLNKWRREGQYFQINEDKKAFTKTEILVKTSQEYAGGVKSNKEDAKG